MALDVQVKDMLEAGVHFGHQTRRWNPKMRPYIFANRDGIHIIDLDQTAEQARQAYKFAADTVALGHSVLFVGTKKQAHDIIESEAKRSKQFYVSNRWLGGMLTNFKTIKQSIERLNGLCAQKERGELEKFTKKEGLQVEREIAKLEHSLGGIKDMTKVPGAVFLIDPNHEMIAKKEAVKLRIPVIALIDTNSDPDDIDYLIAGNDDAIRSIQYFTRLIADACINGAVRYEALLREQEAKSVKEAKEGRAKGPAVREKKIGGKGRAWVARREEGKEKEAEPDIEKFAHAKAEEQTEPETTAGEGTKETK